MSVPAAGTPPLDPDDLAAFRRHARQWLARSMPRRDPDADPRAAMTSDEHDRFSRARRLQRTLHEGGFGGLAFPSAYGGAGLTPAHQQVLVEESADYEMPVRFVMPTIGIIAPTLLDFGTEDQKRAHLPPMLRGEHLWVQFLSEPTGGSDLAGATTRATRDGDTWVLSGSKVWSSAAYAADFALCLARTDWDAPKHRGLTMFIVAVRQPGIELVRIRQLDGSSEFCQEFFDDVRLPADAVLGEVHGGWTVAARLLAHERDAVGGGSPFIGNTGPRVAAGGERHLAALALATGQADDGRVRDLVGEAHVLATVGRQLVARVTLGVRTGALAGPAGAVLKLYGATTSVRTTTIAADIAGPAATAWAPAGAGGDDDGGRPGRAYLMRQGICLAGGSNEMQRNIISERLLGMPREPSADRDVAFSAVPRNQLARPARGGAHG